jgi:hypothetical protein
MLDARSIDMKTALLVIDPQKAYYKAVDAASMDSAVEHINAILPAFRARGLPGEARIEKRYNNGFN